MNYTITFSPSIDYIIKNDSFDSEGLTRFKEYYLFPGGKGINASFIMNQLGVKNKALTYTYGQTKQLFLDLLKKNNIKNYQNIDIRNDLDIRINIKYFSDKSFEINGPSPIINKKELNLLKAKLSQLKANDIVFIMGKCDDNVLIDLVEFIKSKNAEFVIDVDSSILLKVLKYNPLLIKPNKDELQRLLNKKINTQEDLINSLRFLKEQGSKNVIVSLGSDGSILLDDKNKIYQASFKKLDEVKSTVGCGDTLVSSFISFKYNLNQNSKQAFKNATAMSMSTACEWFLGTLEKSKKFISKIDIRNIE